MGISLSHFHLLVNQTISSKFRVIQQKQNDKQRESTNRKRNQDSLIIITNNTLLLLIQNGSKFRIWTFSQHFIEFIQSE